MLVVGCLLFVGIWLFMVSVFGCCLFIWAYLLLCSVDRRQLLVVDLGSLIIGCVLFVVHLVAVTCCWRSVAVDWW